MLNVFGWLRSQARQAVLGGISDALAEVATEEQPANLDQLRVMLAAAGSGAKALSAPTGDEVPAESTKGKRTK